MSSSQSNRRVFMLRVITASSAFAAGHALAADEIKRSMEKLTETDSYARSMGFKLDTKDVDQKRYKRHAVDQMCSNCQLFTPADAGGGMGHCSFFGGRLVNENGWCRNYKPKKDA
jgi:hypothetical protein